MNKIVILDTWINNLNLGNRIIMDAVCNTLREVFPQDFFYHVPPLEYPIGNASNQILNMADFMFYAGTNVLRADMDDKWSEWRVRLEDKAVKNVILLGVGWWQYQPQPTNAYTQRLLKQVLHRDYTHSVRDNYTQERLKELGFKCINTGCPSLWNLTSNHCASIPRIKASSVLLTFSDWRQQVDTDKQLFNVLKSNYESVYVWPQAAEDYEYASIICDKSVDYITPSLEALDEFLKRTDVDFVGCRLHSGIRALQHSRRTIIIAVDNRAKEMGKDFNLPIRDRDKIGQHLEDMIHGSWATNIRLDVQAIDLWKRQFIDRCHKEQSFPLIDRSDKDRSFPILAKIVNRMKRI